MRNFKGGDVTVFLLRKNEGGWGFEILTSIKVWRVVGVPQNDELFVDLKAKRLRPKDVVLVGHTVDQPNELPGIFLMEKINQGGCPFLTGDHHFLSGPGGRRGDYIEGRSGDPNFPMTYMKVEGKRFTWTFWSPDYSQEV